MRAINKKGEMLEWLKRHAWKACIRQKRIAGSNPAFSAGPMGNSPEEKYNAYKIIEFINKRIKNNKKENY